MLAMECIDLLVCAQISLKHGQSEILSTNAQPGRAVTLLLRIISTRDFFFFFRSNFFRGPMSLGKSGKLPLILSNSFQTLFFIFAMCGKFPQSVAFLLYLLRFNGHFANSLRYLLRFCNSLRYLLRFIAILQQFQVFLSWFFLGQFTVFPLVVKGGVKTSKIEDRFSGKLNKFLLQNLYDRRRIWSILF